MIGKHHWSFVFMTLANDQLDSLLVRRRTSNQSFVHPSSAQDLPVSSKLGTSPRAYVHTLKDIVINSQFDELKSSSEGVKHRTRRKSLPDRMSDKHQTKTALIKLADELRECVFSDQLRSCHRAFQTLTCGQHVAERKVTFKCGHRACPFCAEIRSQRIRENYLPKVEAFVAENSGLTPCHLVITQSHRRNELLSDSVKRLLGNFRKLVRRGFWKKHLAAGGCYAVEFTIGSDGAWHCHLHLLVFRRKFFDVRQFRAVWRDITGDSVNFRIDRVESVFEGLREVVKYISKPIDVSKFQARHLRQVLDLKSVRLFSSFGDFRTFAAGFDVPEAESPSDNARKLEGDCCDQCGEHLFLLHLDIRQQIDFERFRLLQKFWQGKPPAKALLL